MSSLKQRQTFTSYMIDDTTGLLTQITNDNVDTYNKKCQLAGNDPKKYPAACSVTQCIKSTDSVYCLGKKGGGGEETEIGLINVNLNEVVPDNILSYYANTDNCVNNKMPNFPCYGIDSGHGVGYRGDWGDGAGQQYLVGPAPLPPPPIPDCDDGFKGTNEVGSLCTKQDYKTHCSNPHLKVNNGKICLYNQYATDNSDNSVSGSNYKTACFPPVSDAQTAKDGACAKGPKDSSQPVLCPCLSTPPGPGPSSPGPGPSPPGPGPSPPGPGPSPPGPGPPPPVNSEICLAISPSKQVETCKQPKSSATKKACNATPFDGDDYFVTYTSKDKITTQRCLYELHPSVKPPTTHQPWWDFLFTSTPRPENQVVGEKQIRTFSGLMNPYGVTEDIGPDDEPMRSWCLTQDQSNSEILGIEKCQLN